MWRQHLAKFQDWEDFEAGFVQNLMGQTLSIENAIGLINDAQKVDDYEKVIYQIGRLVRRVFDFEPMKNASLHQKKLQTVSTPFNEKTSIDMRNLHDDIWIPKKDKAL